MSGENTTTISNSFLRNLQIVETIALLAASILLQFLIHIIPSTGTPIGAVLLAMFFAPLVAVIFFKAHTAFIVGILSPVLNYFITGLPKAEILPLMTIELVLFVSCLLNSLTTAIPGILLLTLLNYFLVRNQEKE